MGTIILFTSAALLRAVPAEIEDLGRVQDSQPVVRDGTRVGEICIRGNWNTPDSDIRDRVPFFPGQLFPSVRERRAVEADMAKAFQTRLKWRPRIVVRDDGGPFLSIEVLFPERLPKQK